MKRPVVFMLVGLFVAATSFGAYSAVTPPKISSVLLEPASVTGGTAVRVTVRLTKVAPAGGTEVTLTSNSDVFQVPSVLYVPEGQLAALVDVQTVPVPADSTIVVNASAPSATPKHASLSLKMPVAVSIVLSESEVTGGDGLTGTVILSGPAPCGGAKVMLHSDNPAVEVPPFVIVPEGQVSARF